MEDSGEQLLLSLLHAGDIHAQASDEAWTRTEKDISSISASASAATERLAPQRIPSQAAGEVRQQKSQAGMIRPPGFLGVSQAPARDSVKSKNIGTGTAEQRQHTFVKDKARPARAAAVRAAAAAGATKPSLKAETELESANRVALQICFDSVSGRIAVAREMEAKDNARSRRMVDVRNARRHEASLNTLADSAGAEGVCLYGCVVRIGEQFTDNRTGKEQLCVQLADLSDVRGMQSTDSVRIMVSGGALQETPTIKPGQVVVFQDPIAPQFGGFGGIDTDCIFQVRARGKILLLGQCKYFKLCAHKPRSGGAVRAPGCCEPLDTRHSSSMCAKHAEQFMLHATASRRPELTLSAGPTIRSWGASRTQPHSSSKFARDQPHGTSSGGLGAKRSRSARAHLEDAAVLEISRKFGSGAGARYVLTSRESASAKRAKPHHASLLSNTTDSNTVLHLSDDDDDDDNGDDDHVRKKSAAIVKKQVSSSIHQQQQQQQQKL
ncbi:hypothetical protein FVE85_3354 [Porphyridium purpureum]|uniref:Uncharacterized protein n=1 Tax=Porphyridium purpureum TaxID=35688 RepID=A0A5J4YWL9_PORPP|nr:hypothetical protein FVE85_3354 [Porphyridium purpureum]|eukprot:POR7460..scf227_4